MRQRHFAALALAALLPFAAPASGKDFPQRDIQFIIPWNAGGSNDIAARQLQNIMQKQAGVSLIVENLPGATGSIGMTRVARSAPDGYTVGMGTSSTLAQIAQKLTDLQNSQFTPIARVSVDPLILVVHQQNPARNLQEFLANMKQKPVSIGTPGTNNLNHIFAEMTAQAAGSSYIHVPYTGGAKVITDLAGNQIQAAVLKPSESKGQIDAGNVRPLGVFANERLEIMPDIPTFKELGHDVFPYGPLVQMAYVVAPADLPQMERDRLITLFSNAIESPEFKDFADKNGVVISPLKGDELTKEIDGVQNTLNSVATRIFEKAEGKKP